MYQDGADDDLKSKRRGLPAVPTSAHLLPAQPGTCPPGAHPQFSRIPTCMRRGLPAVLRLVTSQGPSLATCPVRPSLPASIAVRFCLRELRTSREAPGSMPPPEAACTANAQEHACSGRHLCSLAATPSTSSDDAPSSSSGGGALRLERPKSAKRRAAEALLHRRFSSGALAALAAEGPACGTSSSEAAKRQRTEQQQPAGCAQQQQQQQQQQAQAPLQRPPVRVAACSDCCSHTGGSAAAACPAAGGQPAAAAADNTSWCSQDVSLPPMDWSAVLQAVRGEADVLVNAAAQVYELPGGVRVHLVSRAEQLPAALGALRASMQDSCVAIDLEWKPEGWAGAGSSRVALMQLASASLAVLVRVNQLGFRMPPLLREFLSDADLTFVGFSWDGSDEGKMRQTFGTGRALFSRFIDLQQVGESLGYHGLGLGALTKQVLGFQPPKDRKVTMSNWEARSLSAKQVQYAALDALITGHIYRGLRLWHASPSACTACRQMLGAVLPSPVWHCTDCDRHFSSRAAVMSHRQQKRHRTTPGVCDECGRHVVA